MAACGAAPGNEPTASSEQAIYGGTLDGDSQANSAVVALRLGDPTPPFGLCSGALIAPNVVLTARHCVGANLTTSVMCDQKGASLNGDQIGADSAASSIHVFTSAQPALTGTPVANGKAIFHTTSSVLCNVDVALLVLDQPIAGVTPLRVRLAKPTPAGEAIRAVGYGQNDQGQPIGTRYRKDGLSILAVGAGVSANQTPLGSNELELGISICNGDSGGPAISEASGAVVGIVARGGPCTDNFGHIYTTLGAFTQMFQTAFAVAGGSWTEESAPASSGPPPPSTDAGTPVSTPPPATTTPPSSSPGSFNLHSGAGNNCSASGTPADDGPVTIGVMLAAALCAVRRRRAR